jgi:hypothetical protein
MGRCYQWHQPGGLGVTVVAGVEAVGYHSMARAVVAVETVLWMKGAKTLVEGNKIEALVGEVRLHDTLDVRESVGCSGEGQGNAV